MPGDPSIVVVSEDHVTSVTVQQPVVQVVQVAAVGPQGPAGSGGSLTLAGLDDVTITTPSSAQVLRFSGSEWVNGSVAYSELTGIPSTFPPSAHTHAAADVVSGTFADARISGSSVAQHQSILVIDWSQLVSIPSTFPPSAHTHTHTASQVTDFSSAADARIAAASIDALSDVAITSPAGGQYLRWNGSQWVNAAIAVTDLENVNVHVETLLTSADEAAARAAIGAAQTCSILKVQGVLGANISVLWNKPAGAKTVHVIAIGGGGGGGGGRRGAAATLRGGGGGGGGGGYAECVFDAADVPASVTVTAGRGGFGGTNAGADNTSGGSGASGGASTFGTLLRADSGKAGTGGSTSAGGGGAAGTGMIAGGAGGKGGTSPAAGGAGFRSAPGGGGGAGISAGNARDALSGAGGAQNMNAASARPGVNSGDGGNGDSLTGSVGGTGGAGGGSGDTAGTTAGGGGGNGGTPGAGGGGGGASTNGAASGKGGNGGPGLVYVITYF